MATHSTVWSGILSTSESAISVGQAVVKDSDGKFRPATTANRASYGRSRGVAITAADSANRSFEYQVAGILSDDDSDVADGSAGDWVIVDASGNLERDASPDAGEDVIGRCPHTNGDVQVAPGVWDSTNTSPGGGATVPAAGLVGSDGSALTSVTTSAGVRALVSDETGTGAMVFGTSPTFLTDVRYGATPATFGEWRTANNWYWWARDFANGANVQILGLSASDVIELGVGSGNDVTIGAGGGCSVFFQANDVNFGSSIANTRAKFVNGRLLLEDSANAFWMTFTVDALAADRTLHIPATTAEDTLPTLGLAQTFSALNTFTTGIALGSGTVASAGTQRWASNTDAKFRNAANSADLTLFFNDASNHISFGRETNTGDTYVQSGANNYYRAPTHNFTTEAGAAVATLTSSTATFKQSAFVVDGNARYQPSANIASVQTTDATVTTLYSFTPTDEAVTLLTVEALAVLSTGAEVNSYIRRVKIKRDGGTVTLGSVVDVSTDEDTAAWDCTVDLSGTTVRVRVTGENAKTIDWGCTATRQVMTHA